MPELTPTESRRIECLFVMQRWAVIGEVKKHQNAIAWNSRNEDFNKTVANE